MLNVNEHIIPFSFSGNIPDTDIGFAISADSIDSDSIFALMKWIINTIIDRYGTLKVRFSVIAYGSIVTTRFTFDNTKFTQEDLIRAVNETQQVSGTPDLLMALEEAEILFRKSSRPNATRVLVVLSDVVGLANDSELTACAGRLRKQGVLILSAGFGPQANQIGKQMEKVVVSQSDYMDVGNFSTKRPVVIAEKIMFKALQGMLVPLKNQPRDERYTFPSFLCILQIIRACFSMQPVNLVT